LNWSGGGEKSLGAQKYVPEGDPRSRRACGKQPPEEKSIGVNANLVDQLRGGEEEMVSGFLVLTKKKIMKFPRLREKVLNLRLRTDAVQEGGYGENRSNSKKKKKTQKKKKKKVEEGNTLSVSKKKDCRKRGKYTHLAIQCLSKGLVSF